MKRIFGVYGASGFGKEVMPLVVKQLLKSNISITAENVYFVDDQIGQNNIYLQSFKVIGFDDFLKIHADDYYIVIAIANSVIREELAQKCLNNNIKLLDIRAENTVVLDSVEIGEGGILCPFVTLTSNIKIGKGFHANIYSYVAHDCIIGDYVTFAPAVKCNGNIIIEDHVYIGTGAVIYQGKPNKPLKIGKGAVISAGSVVTKSIPPGMKVFGNPAIEFTKENIKRRM